jgi:hypothetical protein
MSHIDAALNQYVFGFMCGEVFGIEVVMYVEALLCAFKTMVTYLGMSYLCICM